jgi:hypothetical protein
LGISGHVFLRWLSPPPRQGVTTPLQLDENCRDLIHQPTAVINSLRMVALCSAEASGKPITKRLPDRFIRLLNDRKAAAQFRVMDRVFVLSDWLVLERINHCGQSTINILCEKDDHFLKTISSC